MCHLALPQTDILALRPLRLNLRKAVRDADEYHHGLQGAVGTKASQERDGCLCLGTAGLEREQQALVRKRREKMHLIEAGEASEPLGRNTQSKLRSMLAPAWGLGPTRPLGHGCQKFIIPSSSQRNTVAWRGLWLPPPPPFCRRMNRNAEQLSHELKSEVNAKEKI